MQYKIPACNIETLKEKLAKIERKCKKYNCEFSFDILSETFENIGTDKNPVWYKFFNINVSGTAKYGNYEFIAEIEHTEKGNIVKGFSEYTIPERFFKTDCYCEHCKTKRFRRNTYLVRNLETNEFKQVGKACLKDYTNGLSSESVSHYESFFHEIDESTRFPENFSGFGDYLKKEDILPYVIETINKFGFQKSDTFYPTKSRVRDYYNVEHGFYRAFPKRERELKNEMESVNFKLDRPENKLEIENALQWIYQIEDSNNQYLHNLKTVCILDYFDFSHLGILCSLFTAYRKAMQTLENKRKETEKTQNSNYIGKIGDKVKANIIDCKCVYSIDTEYGYLFIYRMIDDCGNVIVWKTSKCFDEKAFTISGTVKKCEEFRNIKQTELTRCKISNI